MQDSKGYKDSRTFLSKYNNITYPEFDYYSVTELNLFSSAEDINFDEIQLHLQDIEKVLPAINRIFAKPIIHLIDEETLVPVESVRLINNKTMNYASNHSEHWANITESGIRPRKLLTNNYRDNYAIYENIVFSRCIDHILNYTRHYSRILSDMIYTNKKLEIDLLERENHISYYLALGKLETGYLRGFSDYIDITLRLLSRLDFVNSVLSARLNRPVYAKCHKVKGKMKLRRTNILAMHKDYRQIYKYMKGVFKGDLDVSEEVIDPNDYLYFCKFLTIFAVGHFNLSMDKQKKIDFKKLDLDFTFKEYHVNIKDTKISGHDAILLTFNEEQEYKIALIPSLEPIKVNQEGVECHVMSPNLDTDDMYISINNIDSFRRIQQALLKGMIYSSIVMDTCPFCGNKMDKEDNLYYCNKCRTEIRKEHCSEYNKDYYVTTIRNFRIKRDRLLTSKNKLYQKRLDEGILHFRNITKMTRDLAFICPYCNKAKLK
ncbi:MAG: hypothetical protein K6E21_05310 [Bacilli bacterium]|nr:hypothetical protein [Bacilli bacterium]